MLKTVASYGGGGGTVTSVSASFTGGIVSVTGSPITTSGTLAFTVAGTSGGIPYFSSSSGWASSGVLAANALIVGGGAGATPATVTTGTSVITALGVNVGTAGAFVVNGGSLGTPSGGTLTSCTGLPISTGVSGLGTGVATALGNNANAASGMATTTGTATLTNKRITQRCNAQTTQASPFAWNSDNFDQQSFSALANALTIDADAGTPTDGQRAIFRIKDDGTARALTWTTGSSKAFRAIGVTLPTTTVINKTVYVGCIYNTADSRWDAVAVAQEA